MPMTTASTPSGQASKELVMTWFAVGITTPEGLAMLTDDFVWRAPGSFKQFFGSGHGILHGRDLSQLDLLSQALYQDADMEGSPNFPLIVAENNTVVLECDVEKTLHDGSDYHNRYCMVINVRDGKIAEVREHTDTLHSEQAIMGTPQKKAAVLERLGRLRAEHGC
jgi:hypothetical protein